MEFYFTLCVIVSRILFVYSYGFGAPSSACVNLEPGHRTSAQSSVVPYTVSLSKSTYEVNGQITVTVTGSNVHQGLLVQARKTDGSSTPVGTFSQPSANTKTSSCTKSADSWTHSSSDSKQTSTAVWTAPSSDVGQVVFKATVASSKLVYWLNIQSSVVAFSAATTTETPTTTTEASTTQAAATDPQETTTVNEATSQQATSTQTATDQNTNSDGSNTNDNGNGYGKNNASCLFTLVAMVTSILLINKY